MKIKLLVAAAATVVASSAMAAGSAFEGFNAQLGAGYNSYSPTITDQPNAGPASTFTLGNGGSIAVRPGLGYTAGLGDTFTLGGLVEYDIVNSKNVAVTQNDKGTITNGLFIQQKNKTTFSLLPGIAIDASTMAYAKLGYSTFTTQVTAPGLNISSTQGSYNYGLGVKKLLDKNIYVFGEGNYSTITNWNKSYTEGTGSTKFAGSSYNLIVGVGYKF